MKTLTAVIWKENDSYVSKCSELGVASHGRTVEEALENLKEAVELYLENAKLLSLDPDLQQAITSEKLTTTFSIAV